MFNRHSGMDAGAAGTHRQGGRWPAAMTGAPAIAAAALLGFALQVPYPLLPDIGWLVVVAERVLGGARLYIDIAEVNPPMSVFLYMPLAWMRSATGIGLLPLLFASILLLSALCVGAAALLMRRLPAARMHGWILAAAFVVLALPLGVFGQREHVALLLLLPYLAAVAARAAGTQVPAALAVAAGLCGGLGMIVKPHFLLCGLLPVLYVACWHGSLRSTFVAENWTAAATAALYAALVVLVYPAFVETWLPILSDTYRPQRMPVLERLLSPGSLAFLLLAAGAMVILRRRIARARPACLLLAALGFYVAALEQGKMWNNHLYPALALAILVLATDGLARLRSDRAGGPLRLPVVAGCVAAVGGLALTLPHLAHRGATTMALAPTIEAIGPAEPRLYAFSGAIAAANPLTAEVEGTWVGRTPGQWLWQFSAHRLRQPGLDAETRARLRRYMRLDRAWSRADFLNSRPDFVLIDGASFDWLGWAMEDPRIRAALTTRYRRVDAAAGVALWARQDGLASPAAVGRAATPPGQETGAHGGR